MAHHTGSFNLTSWYTFYLLQGSYQIDYLFIPALFLVFASSIKSAQVIGHLWLPDSMEAPIPASALIHSATLVSAGVFLLLKFNWILKLNNLFIFILLLGVVTALYGAVIAAAQTDCKKLLAYSTISHCGFLFITIGLNNIYLSITYLYLHGFFKALTFFCVGNLVKIAKGYQDTRKMGQLFLVAPIESVLLVICAINLGALPYTIGYFYKSLLQMTLLSVKISVYLIPFIFISMLASIIYVFRLVFYSLFDIQKNNNSNFDYYFKQSYNDKEYSNTTTLAVIFILLLLVVVSYVYFFYILFIKNFIFYNYSINLDFLETTQNIQKNVIEYYHFFYIFFGVILIILIKIECRYEFSFLKKNYLLYYFVLFMLFFQFSFFCLLYI